MRLVTAIVSGDGRLGFLSESGARLFGRERPVPRGRRWEDIFPFSSEDKTRLRERLASDADRRSRLRVTTLPVQGRALHLEIDVRDAPHEPDGRILYIYDVSDLNDLRRLLSEKAQFHDLVGQSKPMHDVFQLIRDVSATDVTVLIEGETGTGKELAASAIHASSRRKDGPFITVNCGGLSDSLINSQLFGHRKGAFTDAVRDQAGVFEAADGGTIFLDEIGDIPMNTQTRILRALEQREITRIGETEPRKVDIRILAATNKDLTREVAEGRFRQDLLYRIRVARVRLPPLRERREDIPLLAEKFLRDARTVTGKPVERVETDAMRLLMDHEWEGNVRELKNAIEFAAIRCKADRLGPDDLPPEVREGSTRIAVAKKDGETEERERILRALAETKGNRDAAARQLGLSRATLYRRLRACFPSPGQVPKSFRWK